jgi:XFP-like protein
MRRFDVATDSDSCPECGARFMVAPCRSCKGKGQTLLFLKCKDCGVAALACTADPSDGGNGRSACAVRQRPDPGKPHSGRVPGDITPGSIHEGGELGYALAHAYGAAFDNPDLIVACVVGDGEAETGPLAASWHCNAFLNPASDGAVLPILHLNGYKIANPTILGRMPGDEVVGLFRGYGYEPVTVAGSDPTPMHQRMAAVLDRVIENINSIKQLARKGGGNGDKACSLQDPSAGN